jgi:hypothetical protein
MTSVIEGTWDLVSTAENYEEYLKAIGVSFIARKAAMKVKPRMISKTYSFIYNLILLLKNLIQMVLLLVKFGKRVMFGK